MHCGGCSLIAFAQIKLVISAMFRWAKVISEIDYHFQSNNAFAFGGWPTFQSPAAFWEAACFRWIFSGGPKFGRFGYPAAVRNTSSWNLHKTDRSAFLHIMSACFSICLENMLLLHLMRFTIKDLPSYMKLCVVLIRCRQFICLLFRTHIKCTWALIR